MRNTRVNRLYLYIHTCICVCINTHIITKNVYKVNTKEFHSVVAVGGGIVWNMGLQKQPVDGILGVQWAQQSLDPQHWGSW